MLNILPWVGEETELRLFELLDRALLTAFSN
jgi:hypothetical protein